VSTLGAWLDARRPAAPPALRARLDEVLGDDLSAADTVAHERLLAAGERLLGELLARGATGRDGALDLLVADALVTYAFEAAADAPEHVAARADAAMRRLSAGVSDASPAA